MMNKTRCRVRLLCVLLLTLTLGPRLFAAAYFVSNDGCDDTHDGLSREQAFATIQRGVDALEPGDTLTILPGEYAENVKIVEFGDPDRQTVIRAAIPGTALLRGDRDAPPFRKVEGRRFAYVADIEGPVLGAHEIDTLTRLNPAAGVDGVDIRPGSYFYDEDAHKLYLSRADFQSPSAYRYTIPVRRDHGFHILNAQNIVLDGLAATGFVAPVERYVFLKLISGFMIEDSRDIVLRNLTAFLNQSGITLHEQNTEADGRGNRVEHSIAYGNQGDGIAAYYPNGTVIRDSVAYLNGAFGVRFYANRTGEVRFLRNLAWGNGAKDMEMKGQGLSDEAASAAFCVALNDFAVRNLAHCVLGGRHIYLDGNHARHDQPLPTDTVRMPIIPWEMVGVSADDVLEALAAQERFADHEFADPVNFDFRLQADAESRAPVGNEPFRGIAPFEANLRYLSPAGEDTADGLSMREAWRTLDFALKQLNPGDTLYLADGRYPLNTPVRIDALTIRGRGLALPCIDGPVVIEGVDNVTLERLQFAGPVRMESLNAVRVENCVFEGPVAVRDVNGLELRHALLAEPLEIRESGGIDLRGMLFAAQPAMRLDRIESIDHANANSYADPGAAWSIDGRNLTLDELRPAFETAARHIVPTLGRDADNRLRLDNPAAFAGRGPLGRNIGLHREWAPVMARVSGPVLHSVTDTTANIEWWAGTPLHLELTWAGAEGEIGRVGLNQTDRYGSYSLTGLEPGESYTVRLRPIHAHPQRRTDPARRVRVDPTETASTDFQTATTRHEPRTVYVATDGNDDRDGLTRETAWRSLQQAADRVRPGDTVLIGGGEYQGLVYLPITGERDRPITFTSIPGEKVEIVGGGFRLFGKHHYRFDALYFKNFDSTVIEIRDGSDLQLSRIHRIGGWSAALGAYRTAGIRVHDNVLLGGIGAVDATQCPDLRIEHNVIYGNMITQIRVDNEPDEPFLIANNIFAETGRGKQHVAMLGAWQVQSMTEGNNAFYLRWPESERTIFQVYELSADERRVHPLFDPHTKEFFSDTLPAYHAVVGPTSSFAANPMMPGSQGFRQGWPQISANDFPDLFAANPELVRRGIGLRPEAFADFHFAAEREPWLLDREWADAMLADMDKAQALIDAGQDAEALDAYLALAERPAPDRLRSAFVEAAALCALRLGNVDRALEIAETMPETFLALRNAGIMRLLLADGRYAELIERFGDRPGHGIPLTSWNYPELDDLMIRIYHMRATAHARLGDLDAAEADLKVVIDAQTRIGLYSGSTIQDLAWLKLGHFYRDDRQDDGKALDAYRRVTNRTRPRTHGPVPVLGALEPPLAEATEAATTILREKEQASEALTVQFNTLLAQGNALALLRRDAEALVHFRRALALDGIGDGARKDVHRRIDALTTDTPPHD